MVQRHGPKTDRQVEHVDPWSYLCSGMRLLACNPIQARRPWTRREGHSLGLALAPAPEWSPKRQATRRTSVSSTPTAALGYEWPWRPCQRIRTSYTRLRQGHGLQIELRADTRSPWIVSLQISPWLLLQRDSQTELTATARAADFCQQFCLRLWPLKTQLHGASLRWLLHRHAPGQSLSLTRAKTTGQRPAMCAPRDLSVAPA